MVSILSFKIWFRRLVFQVNAQPYLKAAESSSGSFIIGTSAFPKVSDLLSL